VAFRSILVRGRSLHATPARRRTLHVAGVVAVAAVALTIAGSQMAFGAGQSNGLTKTEWQAAVAQAPHRGRGCFRVSYPSVTWQPATCKVAPAIPFKPAASSLPQKGAPTMTVGNGVDYTAQVTGTISSATGSFDGVSPSTTETGQFGGTGTQIATTYSLQLNTEFFHGSPACATASVPATCLGWQQFIYDSYDNIIFMQYWLITYGAAACPAGWFKYSPDCYTNSTATTFTPGLITAPDLATTQLTGSAVSGGTDAVTLSFGGHAVMVSNSDSKIDLAPAWNTTEFNVFGDGGGGEANFGAGTTFESQTSLVDGSLTAPSCVVAGYTAETNNLTRTATPAIGTQASPTIVFKQTNASPTTASCATAAGTSKTAPTPPTNLHETAKTHTSVSLAWTAPASTGGTAIGHYLVYKTGTLVATLGTTLTDTVTGLSPGTTYHFTVKAENGVSTSAASNSAAVTTTAVAPTPPRNLHETASTSTSVSLAWTAPASTGGTAVQHYLVYKTGTLVATLGTTRTDTVTGLTSKTTYHFSVKAENGVSTSVASNTLQVTTTAVAPTPPTNLHETAKTHTSVSLAWTAPASTGGTAIGHYLVDKTGTLVATLGTTLTDTVTGLSPGTTYHFSVKAENGVSTSVASNTVAVTTTAVAPTPPRNLHETAKTHTSVSLAWTAPASTGGTAVAHYLLYETGTLVATLGTTRTDTVTGLTSATTYHFSVKAENGVSTSVASNTVAVTTTAVAPTPPTNLHETAKTHTSVSLAWTAPSSTGGSAIVHYLVDKTGALVATLGTTLTHTVGGLSAGTTYHFSVKAENGVSTSAASNTVAVTTTKTAPSAPRNLHETSKTSTSVSLAWTAPSSTEGTAVAHYLLYKTGTLLSTLGTTRTHTVTGLTTTTTYHFTVKAENGTGTSGASNTLSVSLASTHGGGTTPTPTPTVTTTRIYGTTADATAAKELEHQFTPTHGDCPGGSVVLATDANYPDALASQYLAADLGTGTLLTPTSSLSAVTEAALRDEGITHVYVVGGPFAVSTAVVGTIQGLTAYDCGGVSARGQTITVTRIFGQTEYGTAETIAKFVGAAFARSADFSGAFAGTNATGGDGAFNDTAGKASASAASGALRTAIVATGQGFQDAEAASVTSYDEHFPVLLTTPGSLSTQAKTAIKSLGITQVIVMGGPLAVSDTVVTSLEGLGVSVLRIAGKDYTDTAVQLADFEVSSSGLGWRGVSGLTVARGDFYSDGLAGAVVAAGDGFSNTHSAEPLLLTESPTTVGSYLTAFLTSAGSATGIEHDDVRASSLTLLGGPLAVATSAKTAMVTDLGG
jgi:putative cell wall-binding protein